MQIEEAISRISWIEDSIRNTGTFRGYPSRLVLFSSTTGVLGAAVQPVVIGNAIEHQQAFVDYWCAIALVNLCVAAVVILLRAKRDPVGQERRLIHSAVLAILPSLGTGAVLTGVISIAAPEAIFLLPGLWAILFGLGICASRNVLPGMTSWAGVYYIAGGLMLLAQREQSFSPWGMFVTFGLGQLLSAGLLYWTIERPHLDAGEHS